jgi:hypothetical protein
MKIGDIKMAVLTPRYRDAFKPTLLSSPALKVTDEQKDFIKAVLDYACSDSQFSKKAYDAIVYILTNGSVASPVLGLLNPSSATIGDASFTLRVIGTGFDAQSQIIWNGSPEPTTYVSATELTTTVNMATATTPAAIPVSVYSGSSVMSNVLTFTLSAPAARGAVTAKGTDAKAETKVETKFKLPNVEAKEK